MLPIFLDLPLILKIENYKKVVLYLEYNLKEIFNVVKVAKVKLVTFAQIKQIVGRKQMELEAETVEELLDKLLKEYGLTLKNELFDDKGNLKHIYRIVVNGRNINLLDGFKTKLKNDDMVVIMPAVAGG